MMAIKRPNKFLDAADLEHWAGKYASHQLTAWECSDACEYLDFWEWFDLNHPGILEEYEAQYREEHL